VVNRRVLGAAAGVVIDAFVGEPAIRPHPVVLFGRVMRVVEQRCHADRRGAGVLHASVGLTLGAAAGGAVGPAGGTYLAVAGNALGRAALEVAAALEEGQLETARRLLPALVGRDPSRLDVKEMARAAVESVAENTVDAIVAPALWAAVAGGPGALGYRAINTMDAMVGHRSDHYARYGWASARLDDVANWVPARTTAVLVAVVRPRRASDVCSVVRRHAGAHPSPNAGVAEAAFAAALGLRLGGTNRYGSRSELRPPLGDGRPAEPGDIARAVRLSRHVSVALVGALAGVALLGRERS
jgi:adenosylcobinamide-phosphate synthase